MNTLIVIFKEPVEGKVKTRLCPPLSPAQAARLAKEALKDTFTELDKFPDVHKIMYLDGEHFDSLPSDFEIVKQINGDLGRRLAYAFEQIHSDLPCAIIAMDTPQFKYSIIEGADFETYDACIGMTNDGGYWVIGFKSSKLAQGAFENIKMSRNDTGIRQLEKMEKLGLKVQILETLTDFDDIESARLIASEFPNLFFSKAFNEIAIELQDAE